MWKSVLSIRQGMLAFMKISLVLRFGEALCRCRVYSVYFAYNQLMLKQLSCYAICLYLSSIYQIVGIQSYSSNDLLSHCVVSPYSIYGI